MNRGTWNWFTLETILNINDIEKTSWVNIIISLYRQYKPRNWLNKVRFTLLIMNIRKWIWFRLETILNNTWINVIISLDIQYKSRNCLNSVTFTLLIMNRGKWMWFRLETNLNNNNIKKTSWVNLIISLDRQYKPRNCLNSVTFTFWLWTDVHEIDLGWKRS